MQKLRAPAPSLTPEPPGETFNNYLFPLYFLHQMVRGADGSDVRRGAQTEHTGRKTRAEEQQVQNHQQRHASYHANQTGETSAKSSFTLSESEFFL